jgi:predicted kinase
VIGSESTRLVIVRGNSGAGKSTVARAVRAAAGRRVALVEQDYLRRVVLRERLSDGTLHIQLIESVVRIALDGGYHVVLEGIFHREGYADMLRRLRDEHRGTTLAYYLSVSFPQSCLRHSTRPQAADFTVDDMRVWYIADDLLGWTKEIIISGTSTEPETVHTILTSSNLAHG